MPHHPWQVPELSLLGENLISLSTASLAHAAVVSSPKLSGVQRYRLAFGYIWVSDEQEVLESPCSMLDLVRKRFTILILTRSDSW